MLPAEGVESHSDEAEMARYRDEVALACRVLARHGIVQGSLGHVSVRYLDGMLLRGRGPDDTGLMFADAGDVVLADLQGQAREATDRRLPSERAIHGSVLAMRPDVSAVVHAHPPSVMACDLAGLALVPAFGAYNMPAARLVGAGVPIFPHPWLIDRPQLGDAVAQALGPANAIILRGHGVVVCGRSVAEATIRALDLETVARLCLTIASAGGTPQAITQEDLASLPQLGEAFDVEQTWRHHTRVDRLERR